MTNRDFVKFCRAAPDKPVMYMWGDYGRPITEATVSAKAKQYPVHYSKAYQDELREKIGESTNCGWIGCDCTGLIKWFLWTGGDIDKVPKYDAETDSSASGWYNTAKVRGTIDSIPERPGLIVSMPGHCGVYVGNKEVIECTKGLFGNGVIKTKLSDRKWEKWCECAYIEYEIEETVNEIPYRTARVSKDCPAYATIDRKQKIGNVFIEDEILYLGDVGRMAAVIYPTTATAKIAFVEKKMVVL